MFDAALRPRVAPLAAIAARPLAAAGVRADAVTAAAFGAGAAACVAAAGEKTQTSLKIVVFDEADYLFAREVKARFPAVPFYLQAGSDAPINGEMDVAKIRAKIEWLLARVAQDGWLDAVILPQLHVLLWGSKRGV